MSERKRYPGDVTGERRALIEPVITAWKAGVRGYAESMAWKRQVHAQHGTRLLESTWAEVMSGDGLTRLGNELTRPGLTLDWNPDRPVSDGRARPMKHEDLARLVRTFMTHVTSNSWTPADLERRLAAGLARLGG